MHLCCVCVGSFKGEACHLSVQSINYKSHPLSPIKNKIKNQQRLIFKDQKWRGALTRDSKNMTSGLYSIHVHTIYQGFSKFTFKGPNRNYHQRQKVRNNCYYKTCFYKHAYYFI